MRARLKVSEGERKKFRAVFTKLGKKTGYTGFSVETILLSKVQDAESGEVMADHVWFSFTKGFHLFGLKEGDLLEFDARVKSYTKGYVNKSLSINKSRSDFKLSNPTKIKIVKP